MSLKIFDLKPLPVELKYAYLEENNQCPVVISSLLNASHESGLLEVLRKNKRAIGWKISDLKGIIPLVAPIISIWKKRKNQRDSRRGD